MVLILACSLQAKAGSFYESENRDGGDYLDSGCFEGSDHSLVLINQQGYVFIASGKSFRSIKPLGYVDGSSLYNGYFAQGFALDPLGYHTLMPSDRNWHKTGNTEKVKAGVEVRGFFLGNWNGDVGYMYGKIDGCCFRIKMRKLYMEFYQKWEMLEEFKRVTDEGWKLISKINKLKHEKSIEEQSLRDWGTLGLMTSGFGLYFASMPTFGVVLGVASVVSGVMAAFKDDTIASLSRQITNSIIEFGELKNKYEYDWRVRDSWTETNNPRRAFISWVPVSNPVKVSEHFCVNDGGKGVIPELD